jgi:hypothetical protein
MVAVRNDRIGAPAGIHEKRALAWIGSVAGDALAGRTVWCAAALSSGHTAGRRLRALLHGDLNVRPLAVEAAEPPAALSRQLDAMLAGGSSSRPLGAAARAAYARGAELAEPAAVGRVGPGDVVVLLDCFTVSFAAPLRECGAHAVWHLPGRSGSSAPWVRAATALLAEPVAAVDAVMIEEWRGIGAAERVSAFIPAASLLDVREAHGGGGDAAQAERVGLAWASLLGDIVEEDRADHVGGTIRTRPVAPPR